MRGLGKYWFRTMQRKSMPKIVGMDTSNFDINIYDNYRAMLFSIFRLWFYILSHFIE